MDLSYRMHLVSWWRVTLKVLINASIDTLFFLWGEDREFAERNEKMLRTWLYQEKKKSSEQRKKVIPKMMGENFINS